LDRTCVPAAVPPDCKGPRPGAPGARLTGKNKGDRLCSAVICRLGAKNAVFLAMGACAQAASEAVDTATINHWEKLRRACSGNTDETPERASSAPRSPDESNPMLLGGIF
jgi:hypothetical protein